MQLSIVSFDSDTTINANTTDTFQAYFPAGTGGILSQVPAEAIFAARTGLSPQLTAAMPRERYLEVFVKMLGTLHSQRDTLAQLFDTTIGEHSLKTLVAQETSDSATPDKQWQVEGVPTGFAFDGSECRVVLAVPDGRWRAVLESTDIWTDPAGTATDSKSISVGGNTFALPRLEISPTGTRSSGGQSYRRFVEITSNRDRAVFNYPINLANAETDNGFDTAALVTASKLISTGTDMWLYVDGQRRNRWFQDINTTSTEIWANFDLAFPQSFTLGADIESTDTPTTITAVNSPAALAALNAMSESGIVSISGAASSDAEYFTYTGRDLSQRQLTGVKAGAYGTARADHTTTDTVTWIQHEVWLFYGDSSLTLDPNTPDADNLKPMFALTSENDRWDYDEFATVAASRSAEWTRNALQISPIDALNDDAVRHYTANRDTVADPASEMGMRFKSLRVGALFYATGGRLTWALTNPFGIDAVTVSGEKKRDTANWPTATLQYRNPGLNFQTAWTETTPATTGWEALSTDVEAVATSLGAVYESIRLSFQGGVAGGSAAENVHIEFSDVEVSLSTSDAPSVSIKGENMKDGASSTDNSYTIQGTLTNTTTGDAIYIRTTLELNQTLVIDDLNKKVYIKEDNQQRLGALTLVGGPRKHWLKMAPGTNVFTFADTGTGAITFGFYWYDRNN